MGRLNSFAVFLMIVPLLLVVMGQTNQVKKPISSEDILARQVPGNDLEYLTTVDAVSLTLNYAGAAGGIIRIGSCTEETIKQPWKAQGSPLRQVLDTIVAADPRYRWQHEDGVINIVPATGEPDFLRVRITEFQVKNISSANAALGHLLALPEVKKGMADLNLKHGLNLFVSPKSPLPETFSVHCRDVTLRQALNAIARAQGRAVWDYIEMHCDGKNEVVIRF
jgi:hypothetical protein